VKFEIQKTPKGKQAVKRSYRGIGEGGDKGMVLSFTLAIISYGKEKNYGQN
jgi:hypothetical protein